MTENFFEYIRDNFLHIREEMEKAAIQAGVSGQSITLMGATKTVAPEAINYAISLGLDTIGENRVQELVGKYDKLDLAACDCQFIGQLQTNKIKHLVGRVSQVQSIDNMGQVKELARLLNNSSAQMKALIEVNIGDEPGKGGVSPDALVEFIDEARAYIPINGLMAIPPICDNQSKLCDYFLRMKQYFVDIKAKKMDNVSMNILSMGMSSDFIAAIACGANLVRVGTSLFGKRNS